MVKRRGADKSPKLIRPLRNTRTGLTATALVLSLLAGGAVLARRIGLTAQPMQESSSVKPAAFASGTPSKEYVYAGGRLVATEEPSGGCGTPPPSPGNSLVAAAQSTTSVALNWASSPGADHYEVQRRQNIGTNWSTLSPNPLTNSFADNTASAGIAYLYQVRAVDAGGLCPSAFSNVDLATTVIFVDDPLQSQVTLIKAQHITQVRQAVDAVRVTANIGAASWTNPLNPLDTVLAVHFSELRTRLNEALPLLGFSQMPIDPAIIPGNTIFATHLQAVRQKVK
ncbi:MAG: fibronectin type III domain-containing protein [Acidobacteriota bacterium]